MYNHYVDKRNQNLKKTQFKVEDIFGDFIKKGNISQDRIFKPNNFFSQNDVDINVKKYVNFSYLERREILTIKRLLLPNIIFSTLFTKKRCVGGRQYSNMINWNV